MSDIKDNNPINLCFACSNEYSPYLATTLVSLLEKLDKDRDLNLFILTEDFSEESKKKYEKLKNIHDFNIQFTYMKNSDYDFLPKDIKCPIHVSRIAASRILLPMIFPQLDKILVLEVDQLINDDISKLYDVDLEHYALAAVEDFASVRHSLDLWKEKSDYFNCGVILINLKKLREVNYLEIFKEKISKNGHRYKLQEQDIWNDGLRGDIKRLDIKWNFYHEYLGEKLKQIHQFVPRNEKEYALACKKPSIYHFVSEEKCWFPTSKKPYIKKYRYYERKNPFYKIIKLHKYAINQTKYKVFTFAGINIFEYSKNLAYKYFKIFGITLYERKINKYNNSCLETIFSVKNSSNKKHKIVTILGVKIKLKRKASLETILINQIRGVLREEVSHIVAREVSTALAVQKLHMQTFPQFKNINHRKDVAIVGCGPTVKYYDIKLNTIDIALNKSILLENFNFKYLFSWDYYGFKKYGELDFFDNIKNLDCIKFFGRFLSETSPEIPILPNDLENKIYHFYSSARNGLPAQNYGRIIHADIETHPLADFMSVSFAALHFALYTQPKRIYLIGLDTTNSGHILNCNHEYYVNDLLQGYKKFKEHIDRFYPDIEIISVNPVGLKGMFKDVYTQSYVDAHPELLDENIEILQDEKCLVNS